jgi:hypothetical protein
VEGREIYHPRWSNHVRFLCITGPYCGGEGDNQIRAGGAAVGVFVGRFSENLTSVEQWVMVADHDKADFYPDVWINPESTAR